MGNRSRYVAVTAAAAGAAVLTARRRARLRRAAEGVRASILPTHVVELPAEEAGPASDEAHARGHRHLGTPPPEGRRRAIGSERFGVAARRGGPASSGVRRRFAGR